MVGKSNEGSAVICGVETKVLVDSGAMVTLVSESFFNSLVPKPELCSIDNFNLDVVGACGTSLPYLGYIEGDIMIPSVLETSIVVPILVVPDTEYRQAVPGIIGTNVLRFCDSVTGCNSSVEPYRLALEAMNCSNLIAVKSTNKSPIVIHPNEVSTISGLVRKPKGVTTALTEATEKPQLAGLNVCPRVVSLEGEGTTIRVPVRVCNISCKSIKILPHSNICSLSEVKVVDSWKPESEPSRINEPENLQSFARLKELGIKLDQNNMTKDQLFRAQQILGNWEHIFSKSSTDLGKTDLVKHEIKLNDEKPFKQPYHRIPPAMYEEVRQHLREMVDSGAIKESKSPYCSNVVLVRKKDSSLRFCIDLRELNKRTIKDAYTLPRVDDMLDSLVHSKYFSKLDLRSGYWQVELAENDKEKTAFSVGRLGFYQCERMPFGLTNAPSTFQRLMETCMGDLNLKECLIFLDDVLIFSQTFDEHINRLEACFERLETHGLKLKPSKCEFFSNHVSYLGYVVSSQGIHTDPEKIAPLTTWPVPVGIKTLRTFLGFTGYYRRFVKDYAKIVKPLNDLLIGHPTNRTAKKSKKSKTPWIWGLAHQIAFDTIISMLTNPPVLGYADFTKPFVLSVDASTEGLGAVLYQEQDGLERVISYASRGLRASERNYPAHKLEFLCMKWAISEKFHDYLYGNTFIVRTDNNPLTYVSSTAKLDATGHRWLAALGNYNFKAVYKPGKLNSDADGLSRRPPKDEEVMFTEVIRALCTEARVRTNEHPLAESLVLTDAGNIEADPTEEFQATDLSTINWKVEQVKDISIARFYDIIDNRLHLNKEQLRQEKKPVQKYLRQRSSFTIKDGILYRKRQVSDDILLQLVLPEHYIDWALKGLHDDVGHQGRDRTLWLVKQRFFWPGQEKDVIRKVQTCPNCIRRKSSTKAQAHLVPFQSSHPMELVCIDYLSLERSQGGYENILVITDHFTRYAQAIPTRNQTAQTTARVLFENFFTHYSFPARLHSDQGRNFESGVIRELCRIAGVEKTRTTPYHPMGNGITERFNSTLLGMLGTLDHGGKSNWKDYVKPLVHAYNSTRHESTGFSPHYLLFGWHPRLAIDAFLGMEDYTSTSKISKSNYVTKLKKRLDYAYQVAKENSNKQAARHKTRYDSKIRHSTLQVGDRVLIKNVTPKGKLDDKWQRDPYLVTDIPDQNVPVYRVSKENGKGAVKTLHRNLLLPLSSIPYEDNTPESSPVIQKPTVGRRKSMPVSRKAESIHVPVLSETESDSSSDTSSETIPRYVIPPRRRKPAPCVSTRPGQPSNFTNATCDGESYSYTGRSNLSFPRDVSSNRNSSFTRSLTGNNEFTVSESNSSSSNQVGQRSETPSADTSRQVLQPSEQSESRPTPRPRRIRKAPDRYGEWVNPIMAQGNFSQEIYYV